MGFSSLLQDGVAGRTAQGSLKMDSADWILLVCFSAARFADTVCQGRAAHTLQPPGLHPATHTARCQGEGPEMSVQLML